MAPSSAALVLLCALLALPSTRAQPEACEGDDGWPGNRECAKVGANGKVYAQLSMPPWSHGMDTYNCASEPGLDYVMDADECGVAATAFGVVPSSVTSMDTSEGDPPPTGCTLASSYPSRPQGMVLNINADSTSSCDGRPMFGSACYCALDASECASTDGAVANEAEWCICAQLFCGAGEFCFASEDCGGGAPRCAATGSSQFGCKTDAEQCLAAAGPVAPTPGMRACAEAEPGHIVVGTGAAGMVMDGTVVQGLYQFVAASMAPPSSACTDLCQCQKLPKAERATCTEAAECPCKTGTECAAGADGKSGCVASYEGCLEACTHSRGKFAWTCGPLQCGDE